jgi:hypothetical protein
VRFTKRSRRTRRKLRSRLAGNAVTKAATTNVVGTTATGTITIGSKGRDGKNGK